MRGCFSRVALVVAVAAVLSLGPATQIFAQGITLPATGVDLPAHVTAMTTALGTVAVACIGAFVAFLVIRLGLRWVRRAGV